MSDIRAADEAGDGGEVVHRDVRVGAGFELHLDVDGVVCGC